MSINPPHAGCYLKIALLSVCFHGNDHFNCLKATHSGDYRETAKKLYFSLVFSNTQVQTIMQLLLSVISRS
jgi:hypothetical protein